MLGTPALRWNDLGFKLINITIWSETQSHTCIKTCSEHTLQNLQNQHEYVTSMYVAAQDEQKQNVYDTMCNCKYALFTR